MIYFLLTGLVLGLSAGFAPGPLLTLVVIETVRHGVPAGVKAAIAPLITDLPIIFVVLFVLSLLPDVQAVLGVISILGGLFVIYLSYESLISGRLKGESEASGVRSFRKGILVNALSPHPYLFWSTVGASILHRAGEVGITARLSFVGCFYLMLVGSKVVIALFIGRGSHFFNGRGYTMIVGLLSLLLFFFGCFLFYDGLRMVGVL